MANPSGKFGPYEQAVAERARPAVVSFGPRTPGGQTRADLVRSRIALRVHLSELAPGDRLPDVGIIADSLGISEITVRRALETMCQDGLLDRRRGRAGGTFVAQDWAAVAAVHHDPDEAEPLEDFHLLLECGMVALRAGEVGAAPLAPLRALAEAMDAPAEPGELLRLETRFHLQLAEVLGDAALRERVADLLGRLSLLAPAPSLAGLRARNASHRDLLAALERGEMAAAVAALKSHRGRCAH